MPEALPDGVSEQVLYGGTILGADSGSVAASVAFATLTPSAGKTAYLTGVIISGSGATAASVVVASITGLLGGGKNLVLAIPAGVTSQVGPIVIPFNYPIPATGPGVAITVSLPSFGAGNTNAAVSASGFQA